jgi:hypothetical protein
LADCTVEAVADVGEMLSEILGVPPVPCTTRVADADWVKGPAVPVMEKRYDPGVALNVDIGSAAGAAVVYMTELRGSGEPVGSPLTDIYTGPEYPGLPESQKL